MRPCAVASSRLPGMGRERTTGMPLPTVPQLTRNLRRINATHEAAHPFGHPIDVAIRLTISKDGQWELRSARELAPPYAIAFGYAHIPGRGKRFAAKAIAEDLLEQVERTLAAIAGRE